MDSVICNQQFKAMQNHSQGALVLSAFLAVWMASLFLSLAACSSTRTPNPPTLFSSSLNLPNAAAECTPPITEYEYVVVPVSFERGEPIWKVGYSVDKSPFYKLTELIREGDDINNWRELFSIQDFAAKSWGLPLPEDSFNAMKVLREQRCPGATRWNIIEKKSDSILYEWQSNPCQDEPEQHEIAKIIYGKYDRFAIHYVAKGYQLPSDTRSKWIKAFGESKIVSRCR